MSLSQRTLVPVKHPDPNDAWQSMQSPLRLLSQPLPLLARLIGCQSFGHEPEQNGAVPTHFCVYRYNGRLQLHTTRYGPSALSWAALVRVAGVTQT